MYVYLQKGSGSFIKDEQVLTLRGHQTGGRFGDAVAALGDVDHDGYNDVAIGAPYENGGAGCVYIYYGSGNGLRKEANQKICGDRYRLKSFGAALSADVDADNNGR